MTRPIASRPIVIVESPFAGDIEANVAYARECCRDCLRRGEIPFASHLLYPQFLDDLKPEERESGINAGYAFWPIAHRVVFYTDLGTSPGMDRALCRAQDRSMDIEFRKLPCKE